jgi:hypothetical protein
MNRIISILRAAHCRSTHHFFAIDALSRIDTAQGQHLGKILLKYHDDYLIGAKAPDKSFRDFQNHVIHVGDGNWGGAPKACEKWLSQVIEDLDHRRWRKAAYACGVLSHYFTDPLMPLHTAQSLREAAIHRPMEWSICKAYNTIYQQLTQEQLSVHFQLATSDDWMSKAVLAGAAVAHQHYDRLVELYDLEKGCRNPPAGLNEESRTILSELFCIAITGWARVLSRIADSTTTELPDVSLSLTSLLATIDMPIAWVLGRIAGRSERLAVKAIFAEFQRTGNVTRNLPPEVKAVRKLRALDTAHTERLARSAATAKVEVSIISEETVVPSKLANRQLRLLALPMEEQQVEPVSTIATSSTAPASPVLESNLRSSQTTDDDSISERVRYTSSLVDAPSIGPKTAKRFARIGIHTIGQFLAADVEQMVEQLGTRWINAALLEDWQNQAHLVCELQCLCGYKTQLLAAVDCRTTDQLAKQSEKDLHGRITSVCATSEGQRLLRNSKPPTLADISVWISEAQSRTAETHRRAA